MKPTIRQMLRMRLAVAWFRLKRHAAWMRQRRLFAAAHEREPLPERQFAHRTLLLRQLSGADMWLQHNKVINLNIACERLNGLVIRPGETFSYWRLIGKPTRRKGYVEGMVLSRGVVGAGVGGGLCQLSNLIYWMTLHTPLTVVERHRHSYDVFPDSGRTQPFGSGATCYYNYVDLQIRNDTSETFQLLVHVGETHLIGEWRSAYKPLYRYEVYEHRHSIVPGRSAGYVRSNEIRRRILNASGELIADEQVATNEAIMMYEPLLQEHASTTECRE